jgi:hypothetical protein
MCFCKRKNLNTKLVIEPTKIIHEQSSEFTQDEILKIKENLEILINFNDEINIQQKNILLKIQAKLNLQRDPETTMLDVNKNVYLNYYVDSISILSILTEPYMDIVSVVLGGIFTHVTNSFKETNINLDSNFESLIDRNMNTYEASKILLSKIYNNPNIYRDLVLKTSEKNSCTIRDLINSVLPTIDFKICQDGILYVCRQFRRNITIPEMVSMKYWDIYYVENNINTNEFGCAYTPLFGIIGDYQKSKDYISTTIGADKEIVTNDEILKYDSSHIRCSGIGNNNDDLKESYIHAMNNFITKCPTSIVYPWTMTDASIYSCRWYIIHGVKKIDNGSSNFKLANEEFMNWLFIDDGFGNILNPNGVLYRVDLLTSGILSYGKNIPAQNIYPISETVISNSSTFEYKYPGKPKHSMVKIYVGSE